MAQVVWLKRDLRLTDHAPLAAAAMAGPVVVLYVYEPAVYSAPEHDSAHLAFIDASLAELDAALAALGGRITYRHGSMPAVLERLATDVAIDALWSHEETGTDATYRRDREVAAWCRARGTTWTQIPQFGVFRASPTRDGWAKRWERRMTEPVAREPRAIAFADVPPERRRSAADLGLPPTTKTAAQPGGSRNATQLLDSFLADRGVNYRADMSSPVAGFDGCSRLSAHLAYGRSRYARCISARASESKTSAPRSRRANPSIGVGRVRSRRIAGGSIGTVISCRSSKTNRRSNV